MAWVIRTALIGAQPITSISTVQNHPLGTIVDADDPTYGSGEFIYLKGVASTIAGSWVTYDSDAYTTTLSVANAIGPVAVSMAANTAATSYSWYQISGKAIALMSTIASAGALFLTSAGTADDASITGDLIVNAMSEQATTVVTLAEVAIARPFVNDRTG